ncbi:MAG: trehalose-6-phosphate synthase [Rhodothermaceae bacterium]|nr:trehalose-6-phosphate synthase [Rhodothermaceae bacterium]
MHPAQNEECSTYGATSSTAHRNRLIIVANRAPVRLSQDKWVPAVGGLATALLPVLEKQSGLWVSMAENDEAPETQHFPEEKPAFDILRIQLSEQEKADYYSGMANQAIWPVAHYMIQHLQLKRSYFETYEAINKKFVDAVLSGYREGDYIWLQDYHLMLAPQQIRSIHPEAKIAHFWHIPWPAMEVFRILPWARELIQGLLGSDLIGFHIEEYVENFLDSVRVLLGAKIDGNIIFWQGREIRVEAHPIGVDTAYFHKVANSTTVKRDADLLRSQVGTDFLVIGIDRLDYTKGVLSRLLAFESFLQQYEEYHGRVTFYQVATPSRTDVGSYQQLKREVDEAVGRINGAYTRGIWSPVRYAYRTFSQDELCSIYRAADAALITPLRDGMNLVTQEFITATDHGVLVLSELTGAAHILPESVLVNPYDQEGVMNAIKIALELPDAEKKERLSTLKERVNRLDVHTWADGFLKSMQEG